MISEAEHISPDGALRFVVTAPEGDITLGFAGYSWHTHGTILPGASAEGPEAATRWFVGELLSNRLIIAVLSVSGTIQDVWVTDDPAADRRACQDDETIAFRYWDGTAHEI